MKNGASGMNWRVRCVWSFTSDHFIEELSDQYSLRRIPTNQNNMSFIFQYLYLYFIQCRNFMSWHASCISLPCHGSFEWHARSYSQSRTSMVVSRMLFRRRHSRHNTQACTPFPLSQAVDRLLFTLFKEGNHHISALPLSFTTHFQ